MELFIRIKDGKPFEHPIFKDNFIAAFPEVDINNLPPEFAKFQRIPQPQIGPYEVYEGVTYEKFGDTYKDVHRVRSMTLNEKAEKQAQVKTNWAQYGFASWTFDEDKCEFVPPKPYPMDGKPYAWNEQQQNWVEVTK